MPTRHILHINSGFRDQTAYPLANQYSVLFGEPYRNVMSMRLMNAQLPSNYARFHDSYGTTRFRVAVTISSTTTNYDLNIANGALTTPTLLLTAVAAARTVSARDSPTTGECPVSR